MSLVSTLMDVVSGSYLSASQTTNNEDGQYFQPRKLWSGVHLNEEFLVHVNCAATSKQPVLLCKDGDTDLKKFAKIIHGKSPFAEHQFAVVSCKDNPFESWGKALAQLIAPRPLTRRVSGDTFSRGGTLFFDDLEFLPQELQGLLYAHLDHEGLIRFTNKNAQGVEVRVMASSTKDIWRKCQKGLFHADLFGQMKRLTIHCPN